VIWALLAVLAGVAVFSVMSVLNLRSDIELADKLRRNDARLAAERWQVAQERHDALIDLIAQIAEAKAPEVKGAPKQRRKAK
jgi:hypothetical protein